MNIVNEYFPNGIPSDMLKKALALSICLSLTDNMPESESDECRQILFSDGFVPVELIKPYVKNGSQVIDRITSEIEKLPDLQM